VDTGGESHNFYFRYVTFHVRPTLLKSGIDVIDGRDVFNASNQAGRADLVLSFLLVTIFSGKYRLSYFGYLPGVKLCAFGARQSVSQSYGRVSSKP
jgi:hypothetical protein